MRTTRGIGAVLVYDGDCAFCSTSVRWLERHFPESFTAVPYQRADLTSLCLTEQECHERVQWIGDVDAPVNSRESGARAVGALLRRGGVRRGGLAGGFSRGAAALTLVPPASWVAVGVYTLVAANRHRLPGGTPSCRL